jgi:hypothetical protein
MQAPAGEWKAEEQGWMESGSVRIPAKEGDGKAELQTPAKTSNPRSKPLGLDRAFSLDQLLGI